SDHRDRSQAAEWMTVLRTGGHGPETATVSARRAARAGAVSPTMTSSTRVQIVLIGAGAMGTLHARAISQSPDAELSCVVDPHAELAQVLADRFGTRWVPQLDGFRGFDAAIVASPTETHAEWGLRAIR